MDNISISLRVKQTMWSKLLWKVILFAGKYRILSLEQAVKIANIPLRNGAFKFRAGKGKWSTLEITDEFTIED